MSDLGLKSGAKADIFNQCDIEVFSSIEYAGRKYNLKKPLVCNI